MFDAPDREKCTARRGLTNTPLQALVTLNDPVFIEAAQALGLSGVVGNLTPGHEADFVLLNPKATPLLARKTAQANSLEELLFALIVLADDRAVVRTVIAGT